MTTEQMMDLVAEVKDGQVDPIRAYITLYEIEKIAGEMRKELSDLAIDRREQIGEKEFSTSGYKVSVVSTTRFDYRGDFELERLQTLVKNRQEMMKKSFAMSAKGGTFFDENGEIVLPAEPKTTTYLKLEANK